MINRIDNILSIYGSKETLLALSHISSKLSSGIKQEDIENEIHENAVEILKEINDLFIHQVMQDKEI